MNKADVIEVIERKIKNKQGLLETYKALADKAQAQVDVLTELKNNIEKENITLDF